MEEIRNMLDEVIKAEIDGLESLQTGSDEKSAAIDDLAKLYRLKIEEDKTKMEFEDRAEERYIENVKMADGIKDRYFKVGIAAAELILPLIFYASWMKKGFKFEQDGTFTSTTFRGLFNRFRPTKK